MVTSSYIFFIINFGISTLTFQREIKKSFFLWNINLIIHPFHVYPLGANIRVACTALVDVHCNLLERYTLQYQSSAAYARKAAVLLPVPVRYGPSGSRRAATRSVGCSPDKPMLLINSSHEKQTAKKPTASRDRELSMNHDEKCSAPATASPRRACRWTRVRCSPSSSGRRHWATPTSCSEVRRFTGLANYYRRFVESYSELAALLAALSSPTARFAWTPEAQASFDSDALTLALSSAPVLRTFDPTRRRC